MIKKPCPFCGGRAFPIRRTTRDMFDNEIGVEFGMSCHHCGTVVYFHDGEDIQHAVEHWNKRVKE